MALVSERAERLLGYPLVAMEAGSIHDEMAKSPDKPDDVIDLSLAENKLCEDIINEKLQQCLPSTNITQYYTTAYGMASLRQSVANFITKYMKAYSPVDPGKLIVTTGCTALLAMLSMGIADDGDHFLIPAPHYHALTLDLFGLGGVRIYRAPLENGGTLCECLENSYVKAKAEGKTIKCVLILNPDNPTGIVYSLEEIQKVLHFCKRHDLHIIMDEIYSLSVFGDVDFESVLTLSDVPDPQRMHFMWGLSKDFGMSGYRVGVLYTRNEQLLAFIRRIIDSFQVPTLIQHQIANFISDINWMDTVYFPTYRQRLQSSFQFIKEKLSEVKVNIHPRCNAGLYVWADFSKHMKERTFEEEQNLLRRLYMGGVAVLDGGSAHATQPGWFRVIFTTHKHLLEQAAERIQRVLKS